MTARAFMSQSFHGNLPKPEPKVPTSNMVEVDRWIDGRWVKVMVELKQEGK